MLRSHFLLISLLGVWSTLVLAQPTWSALGPEAGDVTAVVVDPRTPDRLLVGTTEGGVYRSANVGLTWALASSGLAANQVSVLLADPSMASTFWAATDLGLFKTTTNGDAWVEVDTGLMADQKSLVVLAFDSQTPATLYAASNVTTVGANTTLLRSTNAGATFSPLTISAGRDTVSAVAARGMTLWVGTSSGLFKSDNGGTTWARSDTGIATSADGGQTTAVIDSLISDAVTPTTLYAGTPIGLYVSTTSGDSWLPVAGGLPPGRPGPVIATASAVYTGVNAKVYRSTDRAATWSAIATGLGARLVRSLAVDPTRPTRLFAGTRGEGLFASTDTGATWLASNTGLGASVLRAVVVDESTNPATLVLGTESSGAFRSIDRGLTWAKVALTASPLEIVDGLVAAPDGGGLYGMVNTPALGVGVLVNSFDHGQTWDLIDGTNLPEGPFSVVGVGSTGPVAAKCFDQVYVRSGATWSAGANSTLTCAAWLTAEPGNPARLIVSSMSGVSADGGMTARIMTSANGGASWSTVTQGLSTTALPGPVASESTVAYLSMTGAAGGLFVSVNHGQTWARTGTVPGDLQVLAADPVRHVLYAATPIGLFSTLDRGVTWQPLNFNLPTTNITALAPGTGDDVLFAGTSGAGLFVLRGSVAFDGGVSFDAGMTMSGGDAGFDAGAGGPDAAVAGDGGTVMPRDAGDKQSDGGVGSNGSVGGQCSCGTLISNAWLVVLAVVLGRTRRSRRDGQSP